MTMRQPPALAAWLLKQFVSGYRSESLSGDLFEEYQTGRTPGWYWREVIAALLVSVRCRARLLLSRYAAEIIPPDRWIDRRSARLGEHVRQHDAPSRLCTLFRVHCVLSRVASASCALD